jgi:hypothetical protein
MSAFLIQYCSMARAMAFLCQRCTNTMVLSVSSHFVPFHFVPGHFVPVTLSPGHFVPGHFFPGHFVPGYFVPAPRRAAPRRAAPPSFPRPPAEFGFALFIWSNLPMANVDVKLTIKPYLMWLLAIGKFNAKKG